MVHSIRLYSSISGVPQLFTKIYKHKCILGYRIEKTAFASLKRVLPFQITITGLVKGSWENAGNQMNKINGMCAFTANEHFNQNWFKN